MHSKFKAPLAVYILWHPKCVIGDEIAEHVYFTLCRNFNKPLVRGAGIPVYFRSMNCTTKAPPTINFSESEYTAIVPLICDQFVIDDIFQNYLNSLCRVCAQSRHIRIYPVALSENAFKVHALKDRNFITISKTQNCNLSYTEKIIAQIKTPILHELCRLLMEKKKISEETESFFSARPVKLFISHSKHDQSELDASKLRDYINNTTQLKTFFDANDIGYGTDFSKEITASVKESVLVVFQSDSYAEREWCRKEVLIAKQNECPVIIVNAIENGEKRTFPYLG